MTSSFLSLVKHPWSQTLCDTNNALQRDAKRKRKHNYLVTLCALSLRDTEKRAPEETLPTCTNIIAKPNRFKRMWLRNLPKSVFNQGDPVKPNKFYPWYSMRGLGIPSLWAELWVLWMHTSAKCPGIVLTGGNFQKISCLCPRYYLQSTVNSCDYSITVI